MSPNDIIGDGDEIFLFSEPAAFAIAPGGILYRDDSAPGAFSLYFDYFGNPVPTGIYYLSLWLDPNDFLPESNETNNASLSWGTVGIGSGLAPSSADRSSDMRTSRDTGSTTSGEAYNGKVLPGSGPLRKVRIGATPQGGRRMEFLDSGASTETGPRFKSAESLAWSKLARARQQVIFPVSEAKPMPNAH